MLKRAIPTLAATAASLAVLAACGADANSTKTPTATSTTAAGDATPRVTAVPSIAAPTQPATPPPSTANRLERAPIDNAEIIVRESAPPQYAVHVTSGLPSGCHRFDHASVTRTPSRISIEVLNSLPDDPGIACTAIYGYHEETIELGSDFTPGETYAVRVNDRDFELHAR